VRSDYLRRITVNGMNHVVTVTDLRWVPQIMKVSERLKRRWKILLVVVKDGESESEQRKRGNLLSLCGM
jgi:predicted amino acid racemase